MKTRIMAAVAAALGGALSLPALAIDCHLADAVPLKLYATQPADLFVAQAAPVASPSYRLGETISAKPGEILLKRKITMVGQFASFAQDVQYKSGMPFSASYTLKHSAIRKYFQDGIDLTVSGRNLVVWTDYSGYDPELNLFGTNAGGLGSVQTTAADRGFDFGGYPIPRVWSISARITY